MSIRSLVGLSLFNAMILSTVFYHVGGERLDLNTMDLNPDTIAKDRQI